MSILNFPGKAANDGPTNPIPPDNEDSQIVWVCPCGNTTFLMRPGSIAECANCGHIVCAEHEDEDGPVGAWKRDKEPPVPDEPEILENKTTVLDLNDSPTTFRHFLRNIEPTPGFVIVADKDGATHTYGRIIGEEQRVWFENRIATARRLLFAGDEVSENVLDENLEPQEPLMHEGNAPSQLEDE